jgi:GGDEF domain-containing protein
MKLSRESMLASAIPLAAPLVIGFAAVAAAAAFDAIALRILLQSVAVAASALMGWRGGVVATHTRQSLGQDAPAATDETISRFIADRRRPTFDRDTGLCVNWYFRLRVEEEIARAERYRQSFTMITVSAADQAPSEGRGRAIRHCLRASDFAGDIGDKIAVLLPHTDRAGAANVAERIAVLVPNAEVHLAQFPQDASTVSHLLGDDEWQTSQELDLAS